MMRHTLFVGLAFGIFLTVACTTDIEADDYGQDCKVDSDCVVIFVGDPCDCDCASDAINVRDRGKYREDLGSCGGCGSVECGPCPSRDGQCSAGRCIAVPGRQDTLTPDAGGD